MLAAIGISILAMAAILIGFGILVGIVSLFIPKD